MHQSAWGGDDDIWASCQSFELCFDGVTSDDGDDSKVGELAHIFGEFESLVGQLSGGGQYQPSHSRVDGMSGELVDEREEEGAGLATARAGHADYVHAGQDQRKALPLHGRGHLVAEPGDSPETLSGQTERLEAPRGGLLPFHRWRGREVC